MLFNGTIFSQFLKLIENAIMIIVTSNIAFEQALLWGRAKIGQGAK